MKTDYTKLLLTSLMEADDYVTSKNLAFKLDISEKTIRKYLNALKYDVEQYGASLEIKQGTGIRLVIEDKKLFSAFLHQNETEVSLDDPTTRKIYVLFRLITADDYLDLYTLADEVYVSPSLLRTIIRSLNVYTDRYGLTLLHSHNYGYRITGSESAIRQCLADELRNSGSTTISSLLFQKQIPVDETTKITSAVSTVLEKYGIILSDEGIHSLVLHILIAVNRTELQNPIQIEQNLTTTRLRTSPEYFVAANILNEVKDTLHIELPENEIIYLAMHISGKQRIYGHEQLHVRVTEEAVAFYNRFLRSIYKLSGVDLFDDEELRVSMYNHIVPFMQRLESNMLIYKNDLLNVKDNFPYAYELAIYGLSFLKTKHVTEAETSYFALHIALSLEKTKISTMNKINVAVVCENVDSFYQLISYRLEQQFTQYINSVQYLRLSDLKVLRHRDDISLVLNMTTKPLNLPIQEIMISQAMTDDDFDLIEVKIKRLVRSPNKTTIANYMYYQRLSNMQTKEDVIREMLKNLKKYYSLPKDYYEQIMKREQMASCEYSNRIAIPHSITATPDLVFASAAILDKPIIWNEKPVQIVFLISLPKKSMTWFMSLITKIIQNENLATALIETEDLQTFQKIFFSI